VGRAPVDVVHHHQLSRLGLLRRLARIQVTAKETPAAGSDDRGNPIAQLRAWLREEHGDWE
jgi:hypothetical protein